MIPHPYRALVELVEASASGEFVCAAPSAEMHVFLQLGRVAWATDSSEPFAFSRWLLEHTALTREVYQEVLESCRRDRLPLGETLVEWRVASREDIKNALRFQISGALAKLQTCAQGPTIFLERARAFASYDSRLTFELDELVVPPAPESTIVHGGGLLDRLAGEIPEAAWFELIDGEESVGQLPAAKSRRVDASLAASSVQDSAELVAFRTTRETLLGVALSASRSVWCRLDADVAFGGALTTICGAAAVDIKTTPPIGFDPSDSLLRPPQTTGDGSPQLDALQAFLGHAPEVLGAVIADRKGEVVASTLRRPWEPRVIAGIVRRRAPLLAGIASASPELSPLEDIGHRLCSLVTAERNLWCFGIEVGNDRRQTLWLFLDRGTAQGLGWAYLTTLSRQVATLSVERIPVAEEWIRTA